MIVEFKDQLLSFFSKTEQTNWGKNQICTKILELYGDFVAGKLSEFEKTFGGENGLPNKKT
jgi:hypothetical protein